MSQAGEIVTEMKQAGDRAAYSAARKAESEYLIGRHERALLAEKAGPSAPLSESEQGHRDEAEETCRKSLDAIVAMFPAMDALASKASEAAGYDTPMYRRILAGFMAIEKGIDMLRRPQP